MEWLRLENHRRSSNPTLHSSRVTCGGHYSEPWPETPEQPQMLMRNVNAPSIFTGKTLKSTESSLFQGICTPEQMPAHG